MRRRRRAKNNSRGQRQAGVDRRMITFKSTGRVPSCTAYPRPDRDEQRVAGAGGTPGQARKHAYPGAARLNVAVASPPHPSSQTHISFLTIDTSDVRDRPMHVLDHAVRIPTV